MTYNRYQIKADSGIFCAICVVLFGFLNFVAMSVMRESSPRDTSFVFVFAILGMFAAQGALHSIWSVLAPVGWPARMAVGVAAGFFWYVAFTAGIAVTLESPYQREWLQRESVTGLLCLPAVLLAVQSPLWGARVLLRWRLGHLGDPSLAVRPNRFGIRHVMVATAVVALALAATRGAIPDDRHSSRYFIFELAIGALAAGIASFVTLLPTLVATLRAKNAVLCLAVIVGLTCLILFAVLLVIGMFVGAQPPSDAFIHMLFLVAGFYSFVGGVLLIVRRIGYRLEWGRSEETTAAESGESVNPLDDNQTGQV